VLIDNFVTTPAIIDSDDEIASKTSLNSKAVTSNSIIMKLKAVVGGMMFTQLIDDVTQPTSENLCEHQNSSDAASSLKNADNNEASSPSQQVCKLSSHSDASTKMIRATSTFTSKNEIFSRTMEMQKKKMEGRKEENEGVNESPSELSNKSLSDSSSTTSEIIRRVVDFDD
jgi:hypothetical protein